MGPHSLTSLTRETTLSISQEGPVSNRKRKKDIKVMWIGREGTKLSLFADIMIVYIESSPPKLQINYM